MWVYNLWDVNKKHGSVSTEQYVGEYEKQKSLDEVEITKVDNLKILDVKFNKELEERYPELGDKRETFGLNQELVKCDFFYW